MDFEVLKKWFLVYSMIYFVFYFCSCYLLFFFPVPFFPPSVLPQGSVAVLSHFILNINIYRGNHIAQQKDSQSGRSRETDELTDGDKDGVDKKGSGGKKRAVIS